MHQGLRMDMCIYLVTWLIVYQDKLNFICVSICAVTWSRTSLALWICVRTDSPRWWSNHYGNRTGLIGRCERTYLMRVSPIRPTFPGAMMALRVAWFRTVFPFLSPPPPAALASRNLLPSSSSVILWITSDWRITVSDRSRCLTTCNVVLSGWW